MIRKADALIPDIQEKIIDFLQSRKFKSLTPLSKIFADPTRHSYYSAITDKDNRRLFLKIRTHDLEYEKKTFRYQYLIGEVLQKKPQLPLAKYVPEMIDGGSNKIDYLLYEFVEGENLGSRVIAQYGATKLKDSDVEQVVDIAIALNNFPIQYVPGIAKRGSDFYKDLIKKSKVANRPKAKNFLAKNWAQFDKEAKYLSHGDFKPNNFLRTKKGLLLTDFETVSISNSYADIASLWAYSIKKPHWRNKLLNKFIQQSQLSEKSIFFLRVNLLVYSLYEHWLLDLQSQKVQKQYRQARQADVNKLIKII